MIPMGSTLNLVRTTYERRIELEQTSWIIHRGCATRAWGLYRLHVDRSHWNECRIRFGIRRMT